MDLHIVKRRRHFHETPSQTYPHEVWQCPCIGSSLAAKSHIFFFLLSLCLPLVCGYLAVGVSWSIRQLVTHHCYVAFTPLPITSVSGLVVPQSCSSYMSTVLRYVLVITSTCMLLIPPHVAFAIRSIYIVVFILHEHCNEQCLHGWPVSNTAHK
jgi:hypothetical protein